jgi:zinc transport system permease protein
MARKGRWRCISTIMTTTTTTTTIKTTGTRMLDDFLIRAGLAGVGLALAAGPLGSFVVWRRMAYFGDATAHAAILGVALALIFSVPVTLGTLVVALAMGLAVSWLGTRGHAMDATLGVLSHSALALGLVAISFVPGVRVDLSAFLFGDILAVTRADLAVIWGGALLVVALIVWRWSRLLTATLSRELAAASGINADREGLVLTLALAVVVAVALKVVGALLIAAMLIIPAAAARSLARSPETMALGAVAIGAAAALAGLGASWWFDTPAGPSIVAAAAAVFLVMAIAGRGARG